MTTYKMTIPPDKVGQTRKFFRERGGVLLWHNQEIGASRSEAMTPVTHEDGTPATRPHWAYGNPEPLRPEDICVRDETVVTPPADWFPKCDQCGGTGRRGIEEIAAARNLTPDQACLELEADPVYERAVDRETMTVNCWRCDGTGHVDRRVRVRLKRTAFGGYNIHPGSRVKADKLAAKLGPDVKHYWTYAGCGGAVGELRFYTEKITPFTME